MPSIPEPPAPLSDDRVALRLACQHDIPDVLIAYQDDPRLHERLGQDRPPSGAELGRAAEDAASERVSGTGVTLTILQPGSEHCCGQLEARELDWDHARADLSIWLAPRVRGQGLARRALRLTAGWLLCSCGLERIQLVTEPGNGPMIAAARGAGFTAEGVLRGYTRGPRDARAVRSSVPSRRRPERRPQARPEAVGRLDGAIFSLLPADLKGPTG
ncbi:MAG: GNAT family N-acetyltransferase [Solirubrobacteraceae bacterium]